MTHNYVRDWREFGHLSELQKLEDLCFIGNPLEEENSLSGKWLPEVSYGNIGYGVSSPGIQNTL